MVDGRSGCRGGGLKDTEAEEFRLFRVSEKMNSPFCVEDFASLQSCFMWWDLTTVRVEFVWKDIKRNKLFIILLDKNRHKMAAIVPPNLIQLYEKKNLIGQVFSLGHFQVEKIIEDYPKIENYSFVYRDLEIIIDNKTKFNRLTTDIEKGFALYPLVATIKTL
ncbi:unnamed protein product [Lactuca virosa]|uniref:Uncharacterized protein n=1 Tax=Lactuca virosa TaxID=75947 RepID=A0AAU9N7I4_9ASTR|nr:unnamed protein product [Lactuca virosa]